MTRWAMLANLERCVGCQTCTAACKHTNATSPAVQWRRVLDIESGSFPNVARTFVPVGCQHCADPPCMHVCPSTATRKRADGIVTIDYDICIGCAYCDVACPYQARFKVSEADFAYGPKAMLHELEREDPARIGVAQKCSFCSDRVDYGLANGLTPGVDPRATPACANACIADALHFGDLDDPNSKVSVMLKQHQSFRMHEEIGTQPGFHYLYSHAAAAPDGETVMRVSAAEEESRLRARGVEPWHQKHWDWKAAGNFMTGGVGPGLYLLSALAALAGASVTWTALLAMALIGLGLLMVLMKIGRPLRAMSVLRQPQRSWMAREAWVAGGFFPLALAAVWWNAPLVWIGSGLMALAFLYCQARILEQAKGIPVWRIWNIVPLIVATGLAEGTGLFLACAVVLSDLTPFVGITALTLAVLVIVRDVFWRTYRAALAREGAPTAALSVLDGYRVWLLAGGLILPLLGIVLGWVVTPLAPFVYLVAGLSAAVVGMVFKLVLITRAGFNQGYALKHTPVRGSGLPGPAIKPGWTKPRPV